MNEMVKEYSLEIDIFSFRLSKLKFDLFIILLNK